VNESDLFEVGVGLAGWGGLAIGLFGVAYQLWMLASPNVSPPIQATVAFADARIVACLSLVPQFCLLTLPAIYKTPRDVPKSLGPAAIFVGAMVVCVWVWMLLKIVKAGRNRTWYSFKNLLIFSAPAIVAVLAVAVFVAVGVR